MTWVEIAQTDPAVRARLHALVVALEESNPSILTVTSQLTVPRTDSGPKRVWVIRDLAGDEIIRIPTSELGADPRAALMEGLAMFCVYCGQTLLDGEIGMCSTCEASEVMGLKRLWESTR